MEPSQRSPYLLSTTHTLPRQTPRNDFGTVLAHAAYTVVNKGAGVVGGMIPHGAILSAAVSSTKLAVAQVAPMKTSDFASTASASTASASTASASLGTGGTSSGSTDAWELLNAQKELSAEGQKFNAAYLHLQNEMQRESREHNAVSNIMKVRHDSAKAAINNIR
ncbi:hypothetical protein SAMN05443572_102330 [Myxococcus fulvus]|uniref:Uncharacterized protein n=1 Tax=Myxococcus fulvus TaxID=33 RepID=A0A511SXB8_MYXFU|nr:hypothetical protein [Myxococcus fulvus]GEN06559.1 hypothetical protein MFU01_15960 [Myxococcus fulvus]SET45188.1 hypothetical protein SAMN05443572_102330 [Myxococcus fulvus]